MGYVFAFLFGCLAGVMLRKHYEELDRTARTAGSVAESLEQQAARRDREYFEKRVKALGIKSEGTLQ